MDKHSTFDFENVKASTLALTKQYSDNFSITANEQLKVIDFLKSSIESRKFFFIINLQKFEIEHVFGVTKWLGFRENDFSIESYYNHVLHPGKRKSLFLIATELYHIVCAGKVSLKFMMTACSCQVALKNYEGNYLLANKISSVFQYDKDNRLVSYLNEFTIMGDYYGQPMQPILFNHSHHDDQNTAELKQSIVNRFLQLKIYSAKELLVARVLANKPGIKQTDLANFLNIPIADLHQYYSRFLNKTRDFFHFRFPTTLDAALYVKREGLL